MMQRQCGFGEKHQIQCLVEAGSGTITPPLQDACLHLVAVNSHITFSRLTAVCTLWRALITFMHINPISLPSKVGSKTLMIYAAGTKR